MNFYLRSNKECKYYPEYHLGKRSLGWKPSFECNPFVEESQHSKVNENEDIPERLNIESVADIRKYVESGDYTIIDEEGREYSWKEFNDEFLNWCPDGNSHMDLLLRTYKDKSGYEFIRSPYC